MSKVQKSRQFFTNADPFTFLFNQRLRLNPWAVTLLMVVLMYAPIFIVVTKENLWWSTGRIGLLNDYGWGVFLLTSIPATLFFFFWMPSGIQGVLNGLRDNKVLHFSDSDNTTKAFEEYNLRFDRAYSNWIWCALCAVGSAIAMIALVPIHQTYINWTTTGPFIFWYVEFFQFLMFFFASLLVVRGLIVTRWFNLLFREFPIDVRILHPDGAGGLSPLGAFSVKVGYLIGIYGLAVVTSAMTQSYLVTGQFAGLILDPVLVFGAMAYLILSPVAFFMPIGAAHSSMEEAKNKAVVQIADQFEADFTELQKVLNGDSGGIKERLSKLEQIQKLHDIVSRFPVWPFNTKNLIRFFSSTLSPLVIAVIPTIIDLLK